MMMSNFSAHPAENSTFTEHSNIVGIITVTLQLILSILIIGGNFLVIITVYKSELRSVTCKFVINLAIADIYLGLCLPYESSFIFVPSLQESRFGCLLSFTVIVFSSTASLLCLTVTVIDRYLSICYPFLYVVIMSNKLIYTLVAVSWLYAFVLSQLPLFGWNNWTIETSSICQYQRVMTNPYIITVASHFIILSLLMLCLYIHILVIAKKQRHRINAEQHQGTSLQPVTNSTFIENAKSAQLMAIVLLCFNICWLPFCFLQLILVVYWNETIELYSQLSVFVGIINSAINPFIYVWKNREYRRVFKRLVLERIPWIEMNDPVRPNSVSGVSN